MLTHLFGCKGWTLVGLHTYQMDPMCIRLDSGTTHQIQILYTLGMLSHLGPCQCLIGLTGIETLLRLGHFYRFASGKETLEMIARVVRPRRPAMSYGPPMDWARTEVCQSSKQPHHILCLSELTPELAQERCMICFDDLWSGDVDQQDLEQVPVRPHLCADHHYHLPCVKKWIQTNPTCPVCRKKLVVLTGYQPPDPSSMVYTRTEDEPLPTFPDCDTLTMHFIIPSGVQSILDPLPGTPYTGLHYKIYLPNNTEGQDLARMLRKGFERRLLFRFGEHPRTHRMDLLIPNGIVFRTQRSGGHLQGGYERHAQHNRYYLSQLRSDLELLGLDS